MNKFFIVTFAVIILFTFSGDAVLAQTSCLKFQSGVAAPSGYGAAWGVFNPDHPLLVYSNCPSTGTEINITVGRDVPNQLVYQQIYTYNAGWHASTLEGTASTTGWLDGVGTITVSAPFSASVSSPFYFVGYVCVDRGASGWKCGCADTSCTVGKWQLQGYTGHGGGTTSTTGGSTGGSTTGGSTTGGTSGGPGVVMTIPGRTVLHPANKTGESGGGGLIWNIEVPPRDEYYLDFTTTFEIPFDWDTRNQAGKIPGLAGGSGTGGCRAIEPNGWSARNTFHLHGDITVYLYTQDRDSSCGDTEPWRTTSGSQFRMEKGREYRITQRVKVNTPNQPNGEDQIWVDGVQVFDRRNIIFRGNVAPTVARVSQIKYHSYNGGKELPSTPSYDSSVSFGPMYLMTCMPDFTKAPGTCR